MRYEIFVLGRAMTQFASLAPLAPAIAIAWIVASLHRSGKTDTANQSIGHSHPQEAVNKAQNQALLREMMDFDRF